MTAEGGVHAPHLETGAVRAHAPGIGGGGTAADPALAAEDTVTATSRAPNTSKCTTKPTTVHTKPPENVTLRDTHVLFACTGELGQDIRF